MEHENGRGVGERGLPEEVTSELATAGVSLSYADIGGKASCSLYLNNEEEFASLSKQSGPGKSCNESKQLVQSGRWERTKLIQVTEGSLV